MNKEITVSAEEELRLRKSFEFGAYLMITHYLVKNYGINELERFARFWGKPPFRRKGKTWSRDLKRNFLNLRPR